MEKTPSTTTRTPAAVLAGAHERLLELLQAVVAEGAELGAREEAAVEVDLGRSRLSRCFLFIFSL
jgi:hypothetical protein